MRSEALLEASSLLLPSVWGHTIYTCSLARRRRYGNNTIKRWLLTKNRGQQRPGLRLVHCSDIVFLRLKLSTYRNWQTWLFGAVLTNADPLSELDYASDLIHTETVLNIFFKFYIYLLQIYFLHLNFKL